MNSTPLLAALAAVASLAPSAAAQLTDCPNLVDINTVPVPVSSTWDSGAYDLTGAPGGDLFFAGHTQATGTELWRTDGTTAGTTLVSDLLPGPLGTYPRQFHATGGRVFFQANDGTHGTELWVSDGTAAGTTMVKDLAPGDVSSYPGHYLTWNGITYFGAFTTLTGYELFRTDGTEAGTWQVAEIGNGSNSGHPRWLTALPSGNGFVFTGLGSGGVEPWVSDGTAAGTVRLADTNPGSGHGMSDSSRFVPLNGRLYFVADHFQTGRSLWRTNGTPAGTVQVVDTQPSSTSGLSLGDHAILGGEIYMSGFDAANGSEVWKTDGTASGTVLVANATPGATSSFPSGFTAFQGEVYFFTRTSVSFQYALMATGPMLGTERLVKVLPYFSNGGGYPDELQVFNGRLVFTLGEDVNGEEWWVSDGTTAGTHLLANPDGSADSSIGQAIHEVASGAGVLLSVGAGVGREVFRTDGTSAGTVLIKDLQPAVGTADADPEHLTPVGSRDMYMGANDGASGTEPFRYTLGGVPVQLADLDPNQGSSSPELFTPVTIGNDVRVFFTAFAPGVGREPYVTDGTPGGTVFLGDLYPGSDSSEVTEFAGVGGVAVFQAIAPGTGLELYVSDGTPAGTQLLKDINPGAAWSGPANFVSLGDRLLFTATTNAASVELWVTDGTAAGTQMVVDLNPNGLTNPLAMTRIGDRAAFFGRLPGTTLYGLYTTDGTAAGTQLVSDLGGAQLQGPYETLHVVDGVAYFAASTAANGRELWRSDLTQAGTYLLKDINPGAGGTLFGAFAATTDKLFFLAEPFGGGLGEELYVTDGTAAGTHMVAELAPGEASAQIQWLTGVGERVYFSALPGLAAGRELYVSDGVTIDLVCDPNPGSELLLMATAASSSPFELVAFGGHLAFRAESSTHGSELFILEEPGGHAVDLGLGASGVFVDVLDAPKLGASVDVRLTGAPATGLTYLAMSPTVPAPLWGPGLAPSNLAWLNPQALTFLGSTAGPDLTVPVPIPANPQLAGLRVHVQGVHADPLLVPSLRTGNGVLVVLGL